METMSRRGALRLAGGAVGAGVVGATSLSGTGALAKTAAQGSARRRRHRTGLRAVMRRGTPLIGMSSPADVWDQRVREVGPGLTARRIFADLGQGPDSQMRLIEQAHEAGMLPVVSYKVGGDVQGAVNGRYNAVARQAAQRLASFNKPTAVTFWHEPYGDMTPAQYVAASKQILPQFQRGKLKVGPILNGWLLDRQQDVFGQFAPEEMFKIWDWFGIDTYQSGSMQNPGDYNPAQRIRAVRRYLRRRGHRRIPIGIGEYNGFEAEVIARAGNALVKTNRVWFGCVWNSTGGRGHALEGARLRAFKNTLADPRAMQRR